MFKFPSNMFLKVVVALVLVGLQSTTKSPNNQANAFDILPFDKPFTIRSSFRLHESTFKDVSDKLSWIESYSLERLLTKIDYYTPDNIRTPVSKTLFKDRYGPMVFNKIHQSCVTSVELFNQILLDVMPLNNKTLDSWMIGPSARGLLSFLQETEGKKLEYNKSERSFQATTSFTGANVKYVLFYKVMDQDDQYRNQIPIRMEIEVFDSAKLGKKKLKFILDFGRPQVISEKDWGWDRFAINPEEGLYMGRSRSCYMPRLKRVFSKDIYNANGFSFRFSANIEGWHNDTLEGQVDFDGRLGMMQTKVRSANKPIFEQKLFNFKTNRRYYTRKIDHESSVPTSYVDEIDRIVFMQTISGRRQDKPEAGYLNNQSLAQILIGSDNMVELGLVRVGGIRARAYSLRGEKYFPYWLSQPSALVESGSEDTRYFNEYLYLSTIYVSESPQTSQANPQLDTVLLATNLLTDRGSYVIRFYDFVWSANDVEGVDKFSLANVMPGPYKATIGLKSPFVFTYEYKIDLSMLMFAREFKDSDPLSNPIDRDIGLTCALQKYNKWPVQFISDFETKILRPKTNDKIMYRPLAGSLILGHPIRQLSVDLKYLGPASTVDLTKFGNRKKDSIGSLEMCVAFALSSNRKASAFVGFNWNEQSCYICGPEVVGGPNEEDAEKAGYKMNPSGYIQVYQARKEFDNSATEIDKQLDTDQRYKLVNSFMQVEGLLSNASESLTVKIKNIEVEEYEDKYDEDGDDDDAGGDKKRSIDFFSGIGLVENSDISWKIKAEHVNTSERSWIDHNDATYNANVSMTLELCQSIALSYDHIESYSICLRPGDIKCIVSKLSFTDATVGQKLLKAKRDATIKPGIFEIEMPSVSDKSSLVKTKFEKHANCELHNKKYIEAFKHESSGNRHIQNNELIYPIDIKGDNVDGPEHCAQYCFKHNVEFMRKDAKEISKAIAELGNSDPEWATYRDRSGHICKGIGYTNNETLGFCIIEGPKLKLDDIEVEPIVLEMNEEMHVRSYNLHSEIFFDRSEGKRLRESYIPGLVEQAYNKLMGRSEDKNVVNQEELELLKKFIKDGGNFQSFQQFKTPSECALACFSQSQKLWPGCKSFGLIAWPANRKVDCYLNTVTMRETLQNPGPNAPRLIEQADRASNRRMFHFEPRAGFLLDDLNAFKDATMSANSNANSNSRQGHVTFIGVLIIFAIVCIQIIFGLFLGLKLTNYVMARPTTNPFSRFVPDDIENLVPPPESRDGAKDEEP